jgi:hypothetical protein
VQRAIRLSQREGKPVEQYLPAETREYIKNFQNTIGGASGGGNMQPVGATPVQQPSMENVPELPDFGAAQRPQAPELPQEVQSNRIAMAQRMLESGNPDLAAMAQAYLDKGLDEQYNSRTLRSQQEFNQSQAGYNTDLGDWADARSLGRTSQVQERQGAQDRNFARETNYSNQSFQAAENAAERQQRTNELNQTQFWQSRENELNREFEAREGDKDREAKVNAGTGRNPFLDTASGVKLQNELNTEMSNNSGIMANVQRFMDLNRRQQTGGWVLGSEAGRTFAGMTDDEVKEMTGLANEITIGKLGGLGVAISDGDRRFVADSMVSGGSPQRTNENRGNIIIGVLQRKNDYLYNWQLAQMEGDPTSFHRNWKLFIDSTPVVQDAGDGMIRANPMTYEEWLSSRPKYDANGRRVN